MSKFDWTKTDFLTSYVLLAQAKIKISVLFILFGKLHKHINNSPMQCLNIDLGASVFGVIAIQIFIFLVT